MNISSLYNGIFASTNELNNNFLQSTHSPAVNTLNPISPTDENMSKVGGTSFEDVITNEIEKLNNQQLKADELTKDFISGKGEDLHTVMIATEEARLALELAVQVRNKCVEAYKEINNMQL